MDDDIFNSLGVNRMDRSDLKGSAISSVSASASTAAAAAASRQKSCNACVRGKRRCDKTKPRCNRCADKGLECVYQKRTTGAARPPSPPSSSSSVSVVDIHFGGSGNSQPNFSNNNNNDSGNATSTPTTASVSTDQDLCNGVGVDMTSDFPMGDFGMDMTSDHNHHQQHQHTGFGDFGTSSGSRSGSGTQTTSPDALHIDPSLDFSIADLINGTSSTGNHDWGLPFLPEPKANFPVPVPMPMSTPVEQPRSQIRDLSLYKEAKGDDCIATDLLQIHDPTTRIGFALDYFTKLHTTFAQTRTVCFIHPRLYSAHLPKYMMSAFCAASAYANRTADTKAWALRLLSDAAREVYSEGNAATTPHEKLARVQAAALLDSMRVLDGDIMLRNSAEKDRPTFMSWVHELNRLKDEIEAGETPVKASKDQPPKSWEVSILGPPQKKPWGFSHRNRLLTFVLFSRSAVLDSGGEHPAYHYLFRVLLLSLDHPQVRDS